MSGYPAKLRCALGEEGGSLGASSWVPEQKLSGPTWWFAEIQPFLVIYPPL